jgi:hypothetical protein
LQCAGIGVLRQLQGLQHGGPSIGFGKIEFDQAVSSSGIAVEAPLTWIEKSSYRDNWASFPGGTFIRKNAN